MQIDKEGANIERVKQEMSENGLLPEEWGGETPMVAVRLPVHCTAVQSNSGARPDQLFLDMGVYGIVA